MLRRTATVLGVLILLVGCEEGERFECWRMEEKPQVPPPASVEEVLAEVKPAIAPLRSAAYGPDKHGITDPQREQVIAQLTEAQAKHGDSESGREAFRQIAEEVTQIARDAADEERWRLAQACIDAFEILRMDSITIQRLGERARLNLGRPKVQVKGFLDDLEKGEMYVFLELIDRQTGEVSRHTVREGQQVDSIRVLEVQGRNNQVLLEYTRIEGLTFIAEGL